MLAAKGIMLAIYAIPTVAFSLSPLAHGRTSAHSRFGVNSKPNSLKDLNSISNARKPKSSHAKSSSFLPAYLFEEDGKGYEKPIVLLGKSQSGELCRLASSLSKTLAGNGLSSALEAMECSPASSLLMEDDDGGIVLSVTGNDNDFVVDPSLLGEWISNRLLTLTTGVLVLDFKTDVDGAAEAMTELAKNLYDMGLISVYVNLEGTETSLEQEVFLPYSDYEICIKKEGQVSTTSDGNGLKWSDMEWELQRIVARALLPPPKIGSTLQDGNVNCPELVMGLNTFFLSLSFPTVMEASPYIEQMCQDVDAMEYRVDLLSCSHAFPDNASRFDVMYQQQQLRALCRPYSQRAPVLPLAGSAIVTDAFPVVFTVRTQNQAGTWPDDDAGIQRMFGLLELGLRSAVEVLDVEQAWDPELMDGLLAKAASRYTSLILGSHHVVGNEVSMDEAIQLYRACRIQNRAHGGKLVLSIDDESNHRLAYEAALAAAPMDAPCIPNIGLVLGQVGSYSRILNERYTPVTHESLPFVAAPGQLSASQIMKGKVEDGLLPSQKYGILGYNIAYSVSPQMQSQAFEAVKLPHTYTRCDVETVEEFVSDPASIWNDEHFGGCSVTIPHKQSIIPHLDKLTDAAKEIGSVNTVIVQHHDGSKILLGDNTDWRGIYNPLRRRLGDANEGKVALILGGGGTARAAAYAAKRLGLERVYYNRTPQKAMDLAKEFGGTVVTSLEDTGDDCLGDVTSEVSLVISTLPAAAKFTLPSWIVRSVPVVFDVNYKPYMTPLLQQSEEAGCNVVRGSEMLWEQGVGQFELWTGRTAPYGVMKSVVLENCLPPSE